MACNSRVYDASPQCYPSQSTHTDKSLKGVGNEDNFKYKVSYSEQMEDEFDQSIHLLHGGKDDGETWT